MVNLTAINSGWILFIQNREALNYLILCHGLSVHHDTKVDCEIGRIVRIDCGDV
jgi:hypothetical protein